MTPKQEAALRQAREALVGTQLYGYFVQHSSLPHQISVALAAIDEALAEQPAQQQEPVAIDRLYIEALIEGLYQNEDPVSIDAAEEFERLLKTPASPPPRKPWVGLTEEDKQTAFDDTQEGGGFWEFADAIEAKLKEKNA